MSTSVRMTGNLLLDAMAPEERDGLLGPSTPVPIESGKVYYAAGDWVGTAYFPTSGVLSITAPLDEDEFQVEEASVGREGFIVAQAVLGSEEVGPETYMGQVPGRMLGVSMQSLGGLTSRPGKVQQLVHGYLQALFSQMGYGAACNARHAVEQRCARWLLQTHDRVDDHTFELRQEFLAMMLGVQRQSVSVAAGQLHRSGFIDYRRGHITIRDREGLESVSCECYEKVRAEYSRLVPLA